MKFRCLCNIFSVVLSILDEKMYVAFARPNKGFPDSEAYNQAYYFLSIPDLFNPPTRDQL